MENKRTSGFWTSGVNIVLGWLPTLLWPALVQGVIAYHWDDNLKHYFWKKVLWIVIATIFTFVVSAWLQSSDNFDGLPNKYTGKQRRTPGFIMGGIVAFITFWTTLWALNS